MMVEVLTSGKQSGDDPPFVSPGRTVRCRFKNCSSLALVLLLTGLLFLIGCRSPSIAPLSRDAPELHRYEFKGAHMGTLFTVTLYAHDEPFATSAAKAAFERINQLEDIMSDYQADSELMRLCDEPPGKAVPVSPELFDVLQRSQKLSEISSGAFDVTVGPYVRLWRFARKRKVLPSAAELASAREAVGYRKLRLDFRNRTVTLMVPHMRLDLGGIAKGYAADQALSVLKTRGINRALIAASGDIAIGDPPPGQKGWRIAISVIDAQKNETTCTLVLRNAGVSTSGDTEQFIEINGVRYSHIVSPATGLGLTERIQATVVALNATTTDSLATAVSVLGAKRGLALVDSTPHTAALVLTKAGSEKRSYPSRRFAAIPKQN